MTEPHLGTTESTLHTEVERLRCKPETGQERAGWQLRAAFEEGWLARNHRAPEEDREGVAQRRAAMEYDWRNSDAATYPATTPTQ